MTEFLTAAETAARLRVTPDAVRRWIAAGLLRASRTPGPHGRGRWRVAVDDVRAALRCDPSLDPTVDAPRDSAREASPHTEPNCGHP
ncbi:MAG: helix-turn-helix domain-containing protein [Burkholderiales bacterium]|nr:helix-turn-helix domain-containing protein [Burkholderiales bacterium]